VDQFKTAEHVAARLSPFKPVVLHRPHAATRAARWFVQHFPGKSFYALKANPDPVVLNALYAEGITHFDVASLSEIRLVRGLFGAATLGYMHPIKPAEAITEAYFEHDVRIFALDSEEELEKIKQATNGARDLTLCVRIAVDNSHASMPLARKFGATASQAIPLLRQVRLIAERVGVCFHVGSQTMDPIAYSQALDRAQEVVVGSSVTVDVVDVGGGFPAAYPGMTPPALDDFARQIGPKFERFLASGTAELWCEPGRALCAEAASLLVRVEARRGQDLHLNDGTYGMLFDAGHFNWSYPVRALGRTGQEAGFSFYGPTCDDGDYVRGPIMLPAEIAAGDYLEIGMLGAYGRAMSTQFNGFGAYLDVACEDDPFGSVYEDVEPAARRAQAV